MLKNLDSIKFKMAAYRIHFHMSNICKTVLDG